MVESEPTARAFLDECLAAAGHDVAVASSGAEAIGWSQTTEAPFDLLLTEIFLPDLSGLHVATRIRTRWPDVRVVFLGDGHDPIGDDTDVPVLVRPFTPDAVSRAIQRALAAGRAV